MSDSPSSSRTVAEYAAAVASAEPTPGGGSVVATTAALAASLGEMVTRLTLARPRDAAVTERLGAALTAMTRLRETLLDLAAADERAYAAYRSAVALPKATPEERQRRQEALDQALEASASAPLGVAAVVLDLLAHLQTVGKLGTKHALTDIQTAALLAEAALKGALLFVEVNARLLSNAERGAELLAQAAERRAQAEAATAAVLDAIEVRFAPAPATP
ncbi:MAG TPA: cyclodeaminase/cyclohydrolase family protein [Thermomicrobiales bacterium]